MRYPDFLRPGDTIGFPAPSFGAVLEPWRSAFLNALKKFRRLGYRTEPGPNAYKSDGIGISTKPEDCGRELTDMYTSGSSQALISIGGGEEMCEILDYVDFDAVRNAPPKWFMGYSDNTNFTFLLPTLCDTAALYAPCASEFGMRRWHESVQDAFDYLTVAQQTAHSYPKWEKTSLKDQEHPLRGFHLTEPSVMTVHNWDGQPFSGRLIGGCLDCLLNLCGTVYDRVPDFAEKYRDDGTIWFLEACDLNVFGIRRGLWELKHAGWFRHVKGFLVGRPLAAMDQDLFGLDRFNAVTDILGDLGVPILMDLDIGHLSPMMPLVSGGFGEVRKKSPGIEVAFSEK